MMLLLYEDELILSCNLYWHKKMKIKASRLEMLLVYMYVNQYSNCLGMDDHYKGQNARYERK